MSFIWAMFKRELKSYFVSPLAYTAIAVFLAITGLVFILQINSFERMRMQALQNPLLDVPGAESLVRSMLGSDIVWALLFIVPLLTMRMIAEERQKHTVELLLTAPMTTQQLVIGKYLGSVFVLVVMLALSGWMPALLRAWGNADLAPVLTGYLGAFLYGAFLLSIGLLASSLTSSPFLAAFLSLVFLVAVNVIGWVAPQVPLVGDNLEQFTPGANLNSLAKGVIDSQAVGYFITLTMTVLFITARVVDSQRWR